MKNLPPSEVNLETLLKYASINYPYVSSFIVYLHDVDSSSDVYFHAITNDDVDETNREAAAEVVKLSTSNIDWTPNDGDESS